MPFLFLRVSVPFLSLVFHYLFSHSQIPDCFFFFFESTILQIKPFRFAVKLARISSKLHLSKMRGFDVVLCGHRAGPAAETSQRQSRASHI
ncbi:hypothetical protein V8F33_003477 [Rhypophila sp. PSN 637]